MIELTHIEKVYNLKKSNQFAALKDISFRAEDGEFIAIIGKSGSGKSTLLHIIGLLDTATSGRYLLDGRDVRNYKESVLAKQRAKRIGFVKQDFALIEDYTALDNVMLPLLPIHCADRKKTALNAMKKLKITHLASKEVRTLSGGEKQRVAIARALVNDPKLLLADEPTGALDTKTAAEIMDIFKALHAMGKTVIIVTHDLSIAQQCDRIIEISDGEVIDDRLSY